jgi:hypothetical protein
MFSNISLCHCPEQSVADGMKKDIGIGMSLKPEKVRDLNSSQEQRPLRYQRMDIVSKSHSHPFSLVTPQSEAI